MATPYLGEISMFGGNFAPRGWSQCNGATMSISQNQALFALLGTTYGGNGVTTFVLPNLQGRLAVHAGQGTGLSNYNLGQFSGSPTVALNSTQIPAHAHTFAGAASSGAPGSTTPVAAFPAAAASGTPYATAATGSAHMAGGGAASGSFAIAGGSAPHNNMMPYACVTFVIALTGVFPSRN